MLTTTYVVQFCGRMLMVRTRSGFATRKDPIQLVLDGKALLWIHLASRPTVSGPMSDIFCGSAKRADD